VNRNHSPYKIATPECTEPSRRAPATPPFAYPRKAAGGPTPFINIGEGRSALERSR
jgi:hypothetical protein